MTPRPRRWLVPVAVAAVLGAVLLARAGTAVDDAVLEEARRDAAAGPTATPGPSAPAPPRTVPDGRAVIRADGVDGLRLGMREAEVVAAGFVVGPRSYEGCTPVVPGLADRGPGQGVGAWLVAGRVAAVTVDARVEDAASFLGPGPGDPLADLEGVPGVLWGRTQVAVPWQEAPQEVTVAWVRPTDGVRVAFADTAADGLVGHVQVLADEAGHCAAALRDAEAADVAALPALGPDGWGEVRLGRPLAAVPGSVGLQRDQVTGEGCELVLADAEQPGLLFVVVRDGDVAAVAVDAGTTVHGATVGDPAERVREVYGTTTSYLLQFWEQGLSVDWVVDDDGETLRVVMWPARERVRVPEVDAVLVGPRPVLGAVQLGTGC